ncbi:MAG: 50S ribosomal protein L25 [Planctomycetota bacterium]
MAQENVLQAERREARRRRGCARIRAGGRIPAVAYAKAKQNLNLTVPLNELKHYLAQGLRMLTLDIDGTRQMALVKEVQHGTYDHEILHVDFEMVTAETLVHVSVPVVLIGTAPGAKVGGMVEQELYEMEVSCQAQDIPRTIAVDIGSLEVNGILHVSDVAAVEGVRFLNPSDTPMVICHLAAGEEAPEEAVEAVAEGTVEPEVIGKKPEEGKEEEE